MALTPCSSSKTNQGRTLTHFKTPLSKHRLQFNAKAHPSPNPSNMASKEPLPPPEHPIEVIARIRDQPDRKDKPLQVLHVNPDSKSIGVRADFGYRDFTLDGVSLSEDEDLDSFYKKFVESRVNSVRLGGRCTVMMYGPTGSGKSHTMFGSSKQPGIVYRSLKNILGDGEESDGSNGEGAGLGTFVQVTVLEIYNEEIYDLLSTASGGGGLALGWSKGSASKVKLEVMGKKAKNATFISGNEAGKISKEIQKVEKRRIVKSTLCNDRSSRSHCMVILDVPTVGGRLMLVDMAGSENIEQAGQTGFEAKMQTAKINQGNIALKRVVECIANGDSYVPFRDSKLTMLLQDSFEDDKSKILMILCASPDLKELHKTISTLEYGAKAKCIVRGPHTPTKDKTENSSSALVLGSRIAAMDEFIFKLQKENKLRENERDEAHKELMKKQEEVAALKAKIELMGGTEGKVAGASEEEINLKVHQRTQVLRQELEKRLEECQRMTNEFVELERRRMEERILQQQEEVEMLRKRLEEIEFELCRSREESESEELNTSGFARRLSKVGLRLYTSQDDLGMVKSMDLDMEDQETDVQEVKLVGGAICKGENMLPNLNDSQEVVGLSTVYEEEEEEEEEEEGEGEEEENEEKSEDEEVRKEIIEEKRVCSVNDQGSLVHTTHKFEMARNHLLPSSRSPLKTDSENGNKVLSEAENTCSSRLLRIQNIFTLCGNNRELSQKTSAKDCSVLKVSNKENVEPTCVLSQQPKHGNPLVCYNNPDLAC